MSVVGANAALMGLKRLGLRSDPLLTYNFLLEIEDIICSGFTEISGLGIETQTETKRFGGENDIEYKFITGTRYNDLTLKQGITAINSFCLWDWYQQVVSGQIKRKSGTIYLLDHLGIPTMTWDFYDAYPLKWDGPEFKAGESIIAFQTLVLTHKGIKSSQYNKLLAAARLI